MIKRHLMGRGIILAASLLFFANSGIAQENLPPPPLPTGSKAPAFSTKTLAGKPLSLASLKGKVVLIDFWATWCGPCRMATPTIQSMQKQFGGKGLQVIGISLDDSSTVDQVKPFIKSMGVTYTVSASPTQNSQAAQAYKAAGIPAQYLIDKKGIVRWSQEGFDPGEGQHLAKMIKKLLAE